MESGHFRKDGNEKHGYETEHEAITAAMALNSKESATQKLVTYKCPVCSKYHLGRNGKRLFPEDRKHCREWLKINKKLNKR